MSGGRTSAVTHHGDSELVGVGPGPTLPLTKRRHCLTNVNSTHTHMVGGYDETTMSFIFDWTTLTWSQKQNLSNPRHLHSCFTLKTTTYVVGTHKRMEKYSIAEDSWTTLTQDFLTDSTQTVYFGETVLLIGGRQDGSASDNIYEFDLGSETWTLRPEKLSSPKRNHLAFEIPMV